MRRFFRITLPLISPVLMFLVVVLVVFALQAFAQVEFLTGGGPAQSTETLVYKIFQRQAPDQLGEGAVLSVGLFGVTFVVTLAQFLLLERRVHYGRDPGSSSSVRARRPRHRRRPAGWASAQPGSAARWYVLLTLLSLIVLAPIYFLIVRAISDPVARRSRRSVLTPQGVRFDGFSQAWERGNLGGALAAQPRRHRRHHRAPGGHLDPGRLRLRLPAVPVQAGRVRACSWPPCCCRSR